MKCVPEREMKPLEIDHLQGAEIMSSNKSTPDASGLEVTSYDLPVFEQSLVLFSLRGCRLVLC